jgi:hypothetical protein
VNALDAAFVAYAGISALRQQIRPEQRVHGVISGRDWTPNGSFAHHHPPALNKRREEGGRTTTDADIFIYYDSHPRLR